MIRNRVLFACLVSLMLASIACQMFAPSTPVPVTLPNPTQEIPASALPESPIDPIRTAIPTRTPDQAKLTESSRPTKEPTMAPSPTPVGTYTNSEAGFSLRFPPDWTIDSQSSSYVTINNTDIGAAYIILVDPGDSLDAVIKDLEENTFANEKVIVKDANEIILGDGSPVETKDMDVNGVIYRISFTSFGPHTYAIIAVGEAATLQAEAETFTNIYATTVFFPPQVFGTPPDQTLGLLSFGDPDPSDLDPALTTTSAAEYVGLLFSGLVRLGPDLQVYPDLAESWEISSSGMVYTFTLRNDLHFGNGNPITTKDIVFSWERAADPVLKSPTAATYLGDIVGFKDKLSGKADKISGLTIIDPETLVVKVDAPKPYFIQKLTYPTAFIVDESSVSNNPADWVFEANSSGPYTLMKYTETRSIIFERNSLYYDQPSIPYVAYLLDAGGSSISRYEDGTLDILYIGGDTSERVRRPDDPLHQDWQSVTSLCTTMVQFNNSIPPFDDINVRKAFALSVDRLGFVERLTNNIDIPAYSILPPAMPGFNNEIKALEYNETAAQQALSASKYSKNMPEIVFNTSGLGTQGRADVDALVATWKQVLGIDVIVNFLDPATFTASAHNDPAHITLYGWCADFPDPQNFLEVLYHSNSDFNVSGYTNPLIDSLLEDAAVDLDPAQRISLYNQAEKALLEDFATVPIEFGVDDVLVRSRLQGFILAPLHASFIPWLSIKK